MLITAVYSVPGFQQRSLSAGQF